MKRPCRCLAGEIPGKEKLADLIRERIDLIPERERAGDDAYRLRLACCKTCVDLLNGTCARCGCYVEIRAARKERHCPSVPPRW